MRAAGPGGAQGTSRRSIRRFRPARSGEADLLVGQLAQAVEIELGPRDSRMYSALLDREPERAKLLDGSPCHTLTQWKHISVHPRWPNRSTNQFRTAKAANSEIAGADRRHQRLERVRRERRPQPRETADEPLEQGPIPANA